MAGSPLSPLISSLTRQILRFFLPVLAKLRYTLHIMDLQLTENSQV
jgi:hypothetical protein